VAVISGLIVTNFPQLDFEKARRLFLSTYAMTLGLWMHCHPPAIAEKILKKKEMAILKVDFAEELFSSLTALWSGYMS